MNSVVRLAGLVPQDVVALSEPELRNRPSVLAFRDVMVKALLSERKNRFVLHRRGLSLERQLVGVPAVEVHPRRGHGLVPSG